MEINEEMLEVYREEADEKIEELNEGLLSYEEDEDEEGLNLMFRASHTLKSSSASLGFDNISELAHSMEDVFDVLRNDEIERFEAMFDLLYRSVDTLEEMVNKAIEEQEEPDKDIDDLLEKLGKVEDGEKVEIEDDEAGDADQFEKVEEIKVDVERLDKLMNLVGELMINEKKLRRLADEAENKELDSALDQLRRLGEDIRNETSKARMTQVSQVFNRFPRTVRDLSKRTDKKIDFEIEGGDLQMDRTILEELGEPLIHCLRNAVDHGIESPEERKENGKPEEGKIRLKAERDGNEAVISVEDDGRGIDVDKIEEKAIENGVIDENHEEITRQEKMELLFDSDMSTNDEVTELSGRGVGMSVVKTTAEKLHGSHSIESTEGEGSRIEMRLPLSLAVVSCFLVKVGDRRFGIPIDSIARTLNLKKVEIKEMQGREVFIYGDEEVVPLVRLNRKMNIEVEEENEGTIVVVENGSNKEGVLVDKVVDAQDFVSKDLKLMDISTVGGVSIHSDGTPIIILNVNSIMGE